MANIGLKVEDILAKNETILWQGKPKKSAYLSLDILVFILTLLGSAFIFSIAIVLFNATQEKGNIETVIGICAVPLLGTIICATLNFGGIDTSMWI